MNIGKLNSITDVKGVSVGHSTINNGNIQTGVTAILPRVDDWFNTKVRGASYVINGFGKSIGLVQINELNTIETPILLTNTLAAPLAAHYLSQYMVRLNSEIGGTRGTVNPVVCECNDGYLNDIRNVNIEEKHIINAIETASENFEKGSVGAGRGMSCYQLKGGIGTASRIFKIEDQQYTIGALVLTNMGHLKDMIPNGEKMDKYINEIDFEDKGSIIIIIATDVPLDQNQLRRVCKRSVAGLSRTGTIIGNGSGDIAITFTTSDPIDIKNDSPFSNRIVLNDNYLGNVFRGAVESVQSAIINSLEEATEVIGKDNNTRHLYNEILDKI